MNLLKKVYQNIISYIMTNRLFITYLFVTFFSCVILRIITIGASWGIRAYVVDLGATLVLGSFCYFSKGHKQFKYLLFIILFIAFLCTLHSIYYTFYGTFASAGELETLGQVETVTGSVFEKIQITNLLFIPMPIIFIIFYKKLSKTPYFDYLERTENSHRFFLVTFIIGASLIGFRFMVATKADYNSINQQWNRSSVVSRFGLVLYQTNDVYQTIKSKVLPMFGVEEASSKVNQYFEEQEQYNQNNKYTNILKDKNIIFVHMESIQDFAINLKINGVEVTPNINKLVKQGLFFENFYPEISTGTSSDTEFTLLSSLMPVSSGTVFVSYYNRDYTTLPTLLKDKGYYTFSMHGNASTMWNRNNAHPQLGYQDMYFQESFTYEEEDVINLGINDRLFFEEAMPILENIESTNEHYMGTIITLSNHSPFSEGAKYSDFDLTQKVKVCDETGKKCTYENIDYLSNTAVGNYLKSVNYADSAIGDFINYVNKSDYFNDTVFVFYGDHDAKLSMKEMNRLYNYDYINNRIYEEDDENYTNYDSFDHELNKKTPLIIWTKNSKLKNTFKGTVKYYMGMIDVMPTLGNMLGVKNEYALGHDIFNIKNQNVVPFPKGNFVTNMVYYNNSTGEYKILNNNAIMDENYIIERKNQVEKLLDISNSMIVYNLLKPKK